MGGPKRRSRVTAADRESVEARIVEVPDLGITASDLTSWSAKELRRTDRAGVRVRGIRPGGAADEAKPSLRDDDVIVAVNGTSVKDVAGFSAALEQMTRGRTEPLPVLVGFDRGAERMVTVVEIGRPGIQDPGLEARKAWVPVAVQALTAEIAEKLSIPGKKGVRVTRVFGKGASGPAGRRRHHCNRRRRSRGDATLRGGRVSDDDPAIQDWIERDVDDLPWL